MIKIKRSKTLAGSHVIRVLLNEMWPGDIVLTVKDRWVKESCALFSYPAPFVVCVGRWSLALRFDI